MAYYVGCGVEIGHDTVEHIRYISVMMRCVRSALIVPQDFQHTSRTISMTNSIFTISMTSSTFTTSVMMRCARNFCCARTRGLVGYGAGAGDGERGLAGTCGGKGGQAARRRCVGCLEGAQEHHQMDYETAAGVVVCGSVVTTY